MPLNFINPFILLAIITLMIFACQSPESKRDANSHIHEMSFQELVQRFEDPNRDSWQKPDLVIKKFGDLQGKTIIDLGAGTGYFSFKLEKAGAKVIAKDVNEQFINYLDSVKQQRASTIIIEKIPYNFPKLKRKSIDGLLIVNTYHHIEDRVPYFRKVREGLKKDGRLVVVDFKKAATPHGPPEAMRISAIEVSQELKKAGFLKIIVDEYSLSEQYILIAKKPTETK